MRIFYYGTYKTTFQKRINPHPSKIYRKNILDNLRM